MKGAYVCSDRGVPAFGSKGCSLHIQEVIRAMMAQGIELSLFAAATGNHCPSDLCAIEFHKLKHAKIHDRYLREQSDIKDNIDILHQLDKHAPYEFIYERYSLWSHAGMSYGDKYNIPTILEVNAPLIEEQKKFRTLHDEQSALDISKRCFDNAKIILAVSNQVADYLDGFSQARGKIHVIPNGVNTDKFSGIVHQASNHKNQTTIGFVGTLKPWHGVNQLIESFLLVTQLHPHTRLLIVGDGPEREALQQQVHELGLDSKVTFTGAVPTDAMGQYYRQMDIAVAPYPEQPSFYFSPLKIYEYMAAGLPTVSSDLGQIGDIIQHGKNGLLYDAKNPESLFFALSYLIHNPKIRTSLGKNAREEAKSKHSWTLRIQSILALAGLQEAA